MVDKEKNSQSSGWCCACPSFCTLTNFIILLLLLYPYVIYDATKLTPMFSEQWFAEVWWWTKFLMLRGMEVRPLPISKLKHHHSSLKVKEFFPERDSEAFKSFLSMAQDPKYDDTILIVRNVWANYTDNPLQPFNNVKHFKEHCDISQHYNAYHIPKNRPPERMWTNFSNILDSVDEGGKTNDWATAMIFDIGFLETDSYMKEQYYQFWKTLNPDLHKRLLKIKSSSHTFLYWGKQTHTSQHAAFVADYFLQISNTKQWKFAHKTYMPYFGFKRSDFGSVYTGHYMIDDYEGQIPYETVYTRPGDLMYFSTWHTHEVANMEPDELGFAIGIRPGLAWTSTSFSPLSLYNLMSFPLILRYAARRTLAGFFSEDQVRGKKGHCIGKYGNPFDYGFNGTTLSRFDYRLLDPKTGKCEYSQREWGFQNKEVTGEWSESEWHPDTKQGEIFTYDFAYSEKAWVKWQ